MQAHGLSHSERLFIKKGVELGVRNDGRARMDYRGFTLTTGVIPHASGSCRLKLDRTDVIVSIKADLTLPEAETPDLGKMACSVECTSSSILEGDEALKNLNINLTSGLSKLLCESKTLDLSSLCVIKGKQVWILHIDAMVLDVGGNLLDAISLATYAALTTTKLPHVEVVGSGEEEGEVELQVSDDPYESKPLASIENLPITVSLTKIGSGFVVDATAEEEQCMAACLSISVNKKGRICGMHKTGPGGISPSALQEMIKCGRHIGLELLAKLDIAINKKKEED